MRTEFGHIARHADTNASRNQTTAREAPSSRDTLSSTRNWRTGQHQPQNNGFLNLREICRVTISTIQPTELASLIEAGHDAPIIDVRTPMEFQEIHSPAARNVPLDSLNPASVMAASGAHAEQPLYIMCRSGMRAEKACKQFQASGYSNAVNVAGGIVSWEKAGLPVVRGRKMFPLDRQVRILAGFLVLLFSLAAVLLDKRLALLSGAIGGGLMYAGVTNWCGFALLLSSLPWNRVGHPQASCSSGE